MQSKLYLLLVILFVFVNCSISAEQKSRKSDSTLDSKKKVVAQDKDDNRYKNKHENYDNDDDDDVDDTYSALSSYADNRFGPSEENYRTRSRWQSSPPLPPPTLPIALPSSPFDDFVGGNDWSRFEYPNNFPTSFPSMSYDNNPMLSNGPSCNSLVDPQYPIFSDTCGAVPQARYTLPNSFGHRERWQIAQILNSLVGSSTDPACTRSLRLLLCPVLFPPCPTRHEPLPVLPCQSYCRAVKARCAIPTLDLLPCDVLPYSSDLCPTNQAYGSFIPPGAHPSMNQPSPMTREGPSSNYPMPRSYPSLQSILSSQGHQSQLTPASYSAAMSASAQSGAPTNLYNGGPYSTDNMNPTLGDFPSRSYMNDYRQAARYSPLTRSSTETRPTAESRFQTAARPAAVSSRSERPTGCTVILCNTKCVGSVDVRGSAPGTRETDLLDPINLVEHVNAIVLTGGSAFGLDAASGVVRCLDEKKIGFLTAARPVPIVPAAVLYDLEVGNDSSIFPDGNLGYSACIAANNSNSLEGNVGAGTGATIGKLFGINRAMKAGLGTTSLTVFDTNKNATVTVGVIVAVNAVGDVYKNGRLFAGARTIDGKGLINTVETLIGVDHNSSDIFFPVSATTLACVATDAKLTKVQAKKVSQMAHDGFARAINPIHTMFDGDIVFTLATGTSPISDVNLIGLMAAQVVEEAIVRAIEKATSLPNLPSIHDLKSSDISLKQTSCITQSTTNNNT